jgi:hypothetical protein
MAAKVVPVAQVERVSVLARLPEGVLALAVVARPVSVQAWAVVPVSVSESVWAQVWRPAHPPRVVVAPQPVAAEVVVEAVPPPAVPAG